MKDLRIVFMGTPDFAVHILDALHTGGYNIVGVITAPDKPAGRGKKINESAVKKYAIDKNLHLLQPEKLKNSEFLSELESLNADLQIVVAFRMLPEVVWAMPPKGTFNLHASLLPQYRGAAPINWAIINGEQKSGVTTFFLDKEIDTGKIILQKEVEIEENETAGELHDKLMQAGADLVINTVDAIINNEINCIPQSNLIKDELKSAPKIFKPDCKINWNQDTTKIKQLIHGLSPYPAAFCDLIGPNGESHSLKIFKVKIDSNESSPAQPGTIDMRLKNSFQVSTANGKLEVLEVQLAGKRKMSVSDFLKGFRLNSDWKLA